MKESTRAYLYRVALAGLALAVVAKVIGPEFVDTLSEFVAAILGVGSAGLAARNTSTKADE